MVNYRSNGGEIEVAWQWKYWCNGGGGCVMVGMVVVATVAFELKN